MQLICILALMESNLDYMKKRVFRCSFTALLIINEADWSLYITFYVTLIFIRYSKKLMHFFFFFVPLSLSLFSNKQLYKTNNLNIMAESILDFSKELNVTLLDQVVMTFFTGTGSEVLYIVYLVLLIIVYISHTIPFFVQTATISSTDLDSISRS
jgi:hypothetical protein